MDKNQKKIEQLLLARQVHIPDAAANPTFQSSDRIATFDIQYEGEYGYVALDVQTFGGELEATFVKAYPVTEPYEPGYFAFREGPLLLAMLEDVMQTKGLDLSLLIIDGHGVAHPRKLGVASWLGVKSNLPSIGVAKDPLIRQAIDLGITAGSREALYLDDELVGFALRTQDGVKPVWVSSGHLIGQDLACDLVYQLRSDYRIIAPIRRADQAARAFARGDLKTEITKLE